MSGLAVQIQFWRPETGLKDARAKQLFLPAEVCPRTSSTAANRPAVILRALVTEWLNYTSQMFEKSWPLYLP